MEKLDVWVSQTDRQNSESVRNYKIKYFKIISSYLLHKIFEDDTVQLCSVYGPGEVKIVKELAERAYINVVYKPRVGITSWKSLLEHDLF